MGCPGVLPIFLDNFGHDRYGDLVKVINQMPFLAAVAALYIGIPTFVSKLQISAFFLFSNFRKRQIALYSPCRSVGQSVDITINFFQYIEA